MKRSALFAIVLAACGGKPTTSSTTSTTPAQAGPTALELWAPVMKPGAIFSFNDRMPGGPTAEEFTTVEATVANVADVPGGKTVTLTWTIDGEPADASSLPAVIVVTDREVRFPSEVADQPTDVTWPATTAVVDDDRGDFTAYIHEGALDGERCYGLGPAKDAGECGDVCYTELCVHPRHGLTGGSGTWWPDFSMFQRRDLTK